MTMRSGTGDSGKTKKWCFLTKESGLELAMIVFAVQQSETSSPSLAFERQR